jgi:hypothetical protein
VSNFFESALQGYRKARKDFRQNTPLNVRRALTTYAPVAQGLALEKTVGKLVTNDRPGFNQPVSQYGGSTPFNPYDYMTDVSAPNMNTGGGSGGTDYSSLDSANAANREAYERLRPQFNELVGKERSSLKEDYSKSKGDYDQAFGDQRNNLEKAYADAVSQIQNFFTGRNLVDSSYHENASRDRDLGFNYNRQRQTQKEGDTYSNLDKQLREGTEAIDRLVYNYDNPNAPQFGSLEEAMSYKQQLDAQAEAIKDSYSKARSARSNMAFQNPAENMLEFVSNLQRFASVGDPAMDNMVSGYIGSYIGDERSKNYYMNLYQNMQKQNGLR